MSDHLLKIAQDLDGKGLFILSNRIVDIFDKMSKVSSVLEYDSIDEEFKEFLEDVKKSDVNIHDRIVKTSAWWDRFKSKQPAINPYNIYQDVVSKLDRYQVQQGLQHFINNAQEYSSRMKAMLETAKNLEKIGNEINQAFSVISGAYAKSGNKDAASMVNSLTKGVLDQVAVAMKTVSYPRFDDKYHEELSKNLQDIVSSYKKMIQTASGSDVVRTPEEEVFKPSWMAQQSPQPEAENATAEGVSGAETVEIAPSHGVGRPRTPSPDTGVGEAVAPTALPTPPSLPTPPPSTVTKRPRGRPRKTPSPTQPASAVETPASPVAQPSSLPTTTPTAAQPTTAPSIDENAKKEWIRKIRESKEAIQKSEIPEPLREDPEILKEIERYRLIHSYYPNVAMPRKLIHRGFENDPEILQAWKKGWINSLISLPRGKDTIDETLINDPEILQAWRKGWIDSFNIYDYKREEKDVPQELLNDKEFVDVWKRRWIEDLNARRIKKEDLPPTIQKSLSSDVAQPASVPQTEEKPIALKPVAQPAPASPPPQSAPKNIKSDYENFFRQNLGVNLDELDDPNFVDNILAKYAGDDPNKTLLRMKYLLDPTPEKFKDKGLTSLVDLIGKDASQKIIRWQLMQSNGDPTNVFSIWRSLNKEVSPEIRERLKTIQDDGELIAALSELIPNASPDLKAYQEEMYSSLKGPETEA